MYLSESQLSPPLSDISYISVKKYSGGRNICVYSFSPDKKSDYQSHFFDLNDYDTGTLHIRDIDKRTIAQLHVIRGRIHGPGLIFDNEHPSGKKVCFYHGVWLYDGEWHRTEAKLRYACNGSLEKETLKRKIPDYILNEKETTIPVNFLTYDPVAQETIIRPLAEAVCIVQGGKTITYKDPKNNKEGSVSLNDLYFLRLKNKVNSQDETVDGYLASFWARHNPLKIQVNVNDIPVLISPETTVTQAMNQFRRKYAQANELCIRKGRFVRQKD